MRLTQMAKLRGNACFAVVREICEFAQCHPTSIRSEASRVPHSDARLLRDLSLAFASGEHHVAHDFHLREDSLAIFRGRKHRVECLCTHHSSFPPRPEQIIVVPIENQFDVNVYANLWQLVFAPARQTPRNNYFAAYHAMTAAAATNTP